MGFNIIAPSHGPVYDKPAFILNAYREWVSPRMKNEVVLPYVSMHGSTAAMVKHLIDALASRGVTVHAFDLSVTDIGKLAIALVDAATLIVGTPTVHVGPHPAVFYAAHLANLLRPKVRYAAIVGSYGWSSKAIEQMRSFAAIRTGTGLRRVLTPCLVACMLSDPAPPLSGGRGSTA